MKGIGIAGLGRIGGVWLTRLHETGIPARGFDVKPPENFGSLAHAMTDDPVVFAEGLTTLIVGAKGILELEALLFDAQNFARRAPELETIVICATLPPRFTRALRGRIAAHIALIDAPFSGNLRLAQRGALSFLIGGPAEAVGAIEPLLDPMAVSTQRMGGFGSAMAAKVMKDFVAASSTAMTRLALDWAQAQGIEERRLLDVIEGAVGRNLLATGADLPDATTLPAPEGGAEAAVMAALVKEVESALDTALAGASLTPPQAMRTVFHTVRGRALH